jgi:hypothetical protein
MPLSATPPIFWWKVALVLIAVVLASFDLVAIEAYQAGGAGNLVAGLNFAID